MSAIPLARLRDDIAERVDAPGAHQVDPYRALAHAPIRESLGVPIERTPAEAEVLAAAGVGLPRHEA